MIKRHPDGKKIATEFSYYSYKNTHSVTVDLSPDSAVLNNQQFSQQIMDVALQRWKLQNEELKKALALHFGPADHQYHRLTPTLLYIFDYHDNIIAVETSDQNTKWLLIHDQENKKLPEFLSLEHPKVIDFLPGFFTELHETLWQEDLMSIGFSKEANEKRQWWRSGPQREELNENTPSVSISSPGKQRRI